MNIKYDEDKKIDLLHREKIRELYNKLNIEKIKKQNKKIIV